MLPELGQVLLSLALLVVWLLLNQSLHPATIVMGTLLALVVPLVTRSLRPASVRMRHPLTALKLVGVVVHDLTVSAWAVARAILTRRIRDFDSHFVSVPLDMRDANGLAVLSMIVCLTPGTAWHELSGDGSALRLGSGFALLIHSCCNSKQWRGSTSCDYGVRKCSSRNCCSAAKMGLGLPSASTIPPRGKTCSPASDQWDHETLSE